MYNGEFVVLKYIIDIIAVLSPIICGWLVFYQKIKNKKIDVKLQAWRDEDNFKLAQYKKAAAIIYGVLYSMRHEYDLTRLFILQPHPLLDKTYVSVKFEACDDGVVSMIDAITRFPIAGNEETAQMLSGIDFAHYDDVANSNLPLPIRALLIRHGVRAMGVKRLVDHRGNWIGNLVGTKDLPDSETDDDFIKKELTVMAEKVQYVLPEYE